MNAPTAGDGTAWRPVTIDDAAALAEHTKRVHEVERLSFLPGPGFFEWLIEQPGIEGIVGLRGGEIVADTGTWLHTTDKGSRCIVWIETSPGSEDLKAPMLAWAKARAHERLDECDATLPRVIRTSVEDHRTGHVAVIEAAGFPIRRVFAEMARPLTDLPQAPPLPEGVEVMPWTNDLLDSARIASNESFADHWGSLPQSPEEFAGFVVESPTFRPDLSFLAVANGRVVSLCICEVDDEDNADRDTDDVYINRVGTLASHRGLKLASHLIVRVLEAAVAAGLDRAALEVDEMSHTNATVVYERLGFETYARSINFVEELETTRTP
jgi:ribosomal protein S18 acetylase RimI-like enzyme